MIAAIIAESGATVAVGSGVWLAPLFLFFCLMIGLLIGFAIEAPTEVTKPCSRIYHITELLKRCNLLFVQALSLLGLRLRLSLLKLQLLIKELPLVIKLPFKQGLLKPMRDARGKPHAEQRPKYSRPNTGEKEFVSHRENDSSANKQAEPRA